MQISEPSLLTTDIKEAKQIQIVGRQKVIEEDRLKQVNYVAGVDAGYKSKEQISKAAIAILAFPSLELVEKATVEIPTVFPYVSGYLSFREIPAVLEAIEKVTITPDLILCDGQGIAHPRRFGLASHLGVMLDLPTIGVAKTRLIGKHQEVGVDKGSWEYLTHKDEVIGAVVRTRTNVKPLYVSIGHKISLPTAIDYVFKCLTKYRLPETTRHADRLASHS